MWLCCDVENFDVGGGIFIFMEIGIGFMKRKPKRLNDDID
ncbi:TPA: hypothetical protein RU491_002484 [Staphylococcus aureus]|nr:hypothetical protein [Staphylococcus aureus]UXT63983.1 hypothetical protein MUA94_11760 [Staphylococcus aureus]WOL36367.1 hypothetical protein RS960_01905 [Staphylococcus aureus]HEA0022224.1 hypothetical protein [Staphylococcus aureus]HEA0040982.1 hypothetical protein [Staphylococcus aureus]HEA0099853.1 hypothetical protein [Staphylococcus aureus]